MNQAEMMSVREEEKEISSPSSPPSPYNVKGRNGFVKGNPGRPKGAINFTTKLRKSLEEDGHAIVEAAVQSAMQGNVRMLETLSKLLLGQKKACFEPTPIPGYSECLTLEEKTNCIMDAVGNGQVAADIGLAMITGLERSEQAEKLRALSEKLNRVEKVISTTYKAV